MLVDAKSVSVQASGMKATTEFKAKLDGMMFDNLINGIYSNKIGAGIREYATNARDGHARRGNLSRPFEVGLPNRDKAFFEVRDFGSSLTHEEVFEIFAVLGESTKRDTNDETGCLGLGSKSAFAYTNAFAVTCWKNGMKRDYSCYIGEAGQPLVSLISEVRSNEEEGVRISYAVKQQDIDDFNKEASHQLRGFDPQPKITRCTPAYKPLNEDNLLLKGTNWKLYKASGETTYYNRDSGKPAAIQGAVAYPVDPHNTALTTAINRECGNKAATVSKLLRTTDILVRFEIGELKMTTSREELAYDDKTCTNIAKKMLGVLEDVQKVLDEEYASCKTLKEARILRAKSDDSKLTGIENTLGIRDRYWQGKKINPRVTFGAENDKIGATKDDWVRTYYSSPTNKNEFVDAVDGDLRIINEYNYRNKFGEIKAQFQWPERSNNNAEWTTNMRAHEVGEAIILFEIESELKDKNKNSLMRRFWKDTLKPNPTRKTNWFAWVKVKSEADAQRFLTQIYHDNRSNQIFLHKLTELKMPKAAKSGNTVSPNAANPLERKMRIMKAQQYSYSGARAEYKIVDLATQKDLPVVFFKDNWFYLTEAEWAVGYGKRYTAQDLQSFIYTWDKDATLYVINGQQSKFYEDNKASFIDAMGFLKKQWMANTKDWERKYAETTYKDDNSENIAAGEKFKILRDKFNVTFSSIEQALVRDKDKLANAGAYRYNRFTHELPNNWREYLQTELDAAVKKYPQPVQTNEYLNLMTFDPVLKYLIGEVSTYNTESKLVEAIKHYKKTIKQ